MDERTTRSTRRGALARLAGLLAGAAGAGALAEAKTCPAAAAAEPKDRILKLYADQVRLKTAVQRTGAEPVAQEDLLPFGALADAKGRQVGSFHSAALAASSGTLHLHTFDLGDGMLLGLGPGGLQEAAYAIVGGTGSYAGAAGAYVARPAVRFPGRPIEFTFTLRKGGA
jgi:hypothetical protein